MLTSEQVESALMTPPTRLGDPMGDAAYWREWYSGLPQGDRAVVHQVLAAWLTSTDDHRVSVALGFLDAVESIQHFGPLVSQLISRVDAALNERSYLDAVYIGFLQTAARLELTEVIPYLRKWASDVNGRSRHWSWTALYAIIYLMQLDREAALEYAPRVARAVVEFPPEPIHVNTVLRQYIHAYVVLYPDHLRELGKALSPVDPSLKSLIEARFRESVSHFVSTRWRTEEWAGEARRQFAEGLTGQPAS